MLRLLYIREKETNYIVPVWCLIGISINTYRKIRFNTVS